MFRYSLCLRNDGFRARRHSPLAAVLGLLLWMAAGPAPALPSAPDAAAILTRTRPALVVLVAADRRGKWKSFGTGFFISADGLLVTARHVAQAEDHLLAITQDGRPHHVTGFLGENRDYDIAVLKAEGAGFPCLRMAAALPETNDWIAVVSPTDQWPALFAQTNAVPVCSTGIVSSLPNLPGVWLAIVTTAPAQPGRSGSPLLNAAGEVVGLVPYLSTDQHATASPIAVAQAIAQGEHARMLPFHKRPRANGATPLVMDPDFRAGCDALKNQNWVEVERRMKRAARSFRDSPAPLAFLATASARHGAWKQVHRYCQQALRLQPESAFVALLDGTSLVMLGHLADGAATVRKSLDLGLPEMDLQTSAWALLVSAETALGHTEEAQKALDQLQRLDPASADKLRGQLQSGSNRSPARSNAK